MLSNPNDLDIPGIAIRLLRLIFSWKRQTYQVCETHIQRAGSVWPNAERVAVHTNEDGIITVKALRAD